MATFLSVNQESNDKVKQFSIELLNTVCVSALGIKIGTYKCKILVITVIILAIVVYIISCKSAVLKVRWKSNCLVIF